MTGTSGPEVSGVGDGDALCCRARLGLWRRRAVRGAGLCVLLGGVLALSAASAAVASDPLSGSALYSDVVHYAQLGPVNHLTGSGSDVAVQDWIGQSLAEAGLQTGRDGYSYFAFKPQAVGLAVDGTSYGNITPYFYSGETGSAPRVGQLAYTGLGTAAEVEAAQVAGKIAVVDVPYAEDALDPSFASAFTAIEHAGAIGLIAVTEGPQDYAVNQDVNSRAGLNSLPTIFIGKQSGAQVIAAAKAGGQGSLLLDATVGSSCATNTWGILPGRDPSRFVIVGTPTTGFDEAAAERGSGVAVLLGLARHYAQVPLSSRPVTLIFVALSGHEAGYLGLPMFMATHPGWFANAEAYVHLGASLGAYQQVEGPNGSVVKLASGDATRALYVSENPLLQAGVEGAFASAQPLASIPPAAFNPGEQSYAYHAGIPIVAENGTSYYFHTVADTPAGVGGGLLATQADSFASTIDYIAGLPAGAVRAGNAVADELGAAQSPNSTPGGGSSELAQDQPTPDPVCAA